MDSPTDDVEARLRALGQTRLSEGAHDATRALSIILEDPEIRANVEPNRRRRLGNFARRHRLVVGGLVALVGVGVAFPAAAATSWLARTGEFGDPTTSSEVVDETEWISLGADDAPQVVIDAYPGYLTLPAGVPADAAIATVSRIFEKMSADAGGQARAQEGLMTQTYEQFAICAWTGDWLSAEESSDNARMDSAAAWLGDTDNFPAAMNNNGGGYADALLVYAAGARDGDRKAVEKSYAEQSCEALTAGGAQ